MDDKTISTVKVQQMFGISEITVRRWVKQGMPVLRIAPRLHRYYADAVMAWAKEHKPWQIMERGE
jgi:phage terminase Nu1 subunit (DNA packaging protein)